MIWVPVRLVVLCGFIQPFPFNEGLDKSIQQNG